MSFNFLNLLPLAKKRGRQSVAKWGGLHTVLDFKLRRDECERSEVAPFLAS